MPENLPSALRDTLVQLRGRISSLYYREWILIALLTLVGGLATFIALDRIHVIGGSLRELFFIIGLSGVLLIGPLRYLILAYRQRDHHSLIRVIRKHRPRLGERIQGALELSQHSNPSSAESPELLQAAVGQIAEEAAQIDLDKIMPPSRLKPLAVALVLLGLAVGATFYLIPNQAKNATHRFFAPLASIERYSAIRFKDLPEDYYLVAGEPSEIKIKLKNYVSTQPLLAEAKIPGFPNQTATYQGGFLFSLPALTKDTSFTLQAGDAFKKITLRPRPRPRIQTIEIVQQFPAYLQLGQRRFTAESSVVEILKGSEISLALTTSEVARHINTDGPFIFSPEGTYSQSNSLNLEQDQSLQLGITDQFGLTSSPNKNLTLQQIEDLPPRVRLLAEEREILLLPHETLDLSLASEDDYGVKELSLALQSQENPNYSLTFPVRKGAPDSQSIKQEYALNPEVLNILPDTYTLTAIATDYLPERPGAHSPRPHP